MQFLKSGWFNESLSKFNVAYSLIEHDVQAPVCIHQLKITLEKLKGDGGHKNSYQQPNEETAERIMLNV